MKKMISLLLLSVMMVVAVGCSEKEVAPEEMVDPPTYYEGEGEMGGETLDDGDQKKYSFEKTYSITNRNGHFIVSGIQNEKAVVFVIDSEGKIVNIFDDSHGPSSGSEFYKTGFFPMSIPNPEGDKPGRNENLEGIMNIDGDWVIEPASEVTAYADGSFYVVLNGKYDDFGLVSSTISVHNREGELIKEYPDMDGYNSYTTRGSYEVLAIKDEVINQNGKSVKVALENVEPVSAGRYVTFRDRDTMVVYDEDLNHRSFNADTGDNIVSNITKDYHLEWDGNGNTLLYERETLLKEFDTYEISIKGENTLINHDTGEIFKIENGALTPVATYFEVSKYTESDEFMVATVARENNTAGYNVILDLNGNKVIDESGKIVSMGSTGLGSNSESEKILIDLANGKVVTDKFLLEAIKDYIY